MNQVHNKFPVFSHDKYRIAIVGDAPNNDDTTLGEPFVGPYGNILLQAMQQTGITKSGCFLGNMSQFQGGLNAGGWQLSQGREVLRNDLLTYKPNVVLLLGDLCLRAAGIPHPVNDYRGSVFMCRDASSPFYGFKCIATFSTLDIMRSYDNMPLFMFDVSRAFREGQKPEFEPPSRAFELHLTPEQICERFDNWPVDHPASIDIEGGIEQGITCMSVADSPTSAFIIDWTNMPDAKKRMVWSSTRRWLKNPDVPKILQNSLYDNMCLSWRHKSPIINVWHDTMLSGWEIYPELPKSLGVQASLWTDEPFYKADRKIADTETHHIYCCKDSCVTYEIALKHREFFESNPAAEQHFNFNMKLLPTLLYSQLRGFRYDKELALEKLNEVKVKLDELQTKIDMLSGRVGVGLNTNSPKQMVNVLYDTLKFESQFVTKAGRKTTSRTCDTDALLNLMKKYPSSDLIYYILIYRSFEGIRKQLEVQLDHDDRIRAGYNPVGTETGRMTCYGSNTGSGYNLQTTTKKLRPLFLADPGKAMCQLDLSGADGWTVAAHAKYLGDSRMMDDYETGVKPAKVICAMYLRQDPSLASRSSSDLLQVIKETEIPDWLYNAAKAVQHGSSYGMGLPTMAKNILKRSWKDDQNPIHISPKDCGQLQEMFFKRYVGVLRWQAWVKQQIQTKGYLDCASGHRRHFFGRKHDNKTLAAAYAHEPQANTTYATNRAEVTVGTDPRNRRGNKFIVEPMHRIHDALVTQFDIADLGFAVSFLREAFTFPLTIAGQQIVIPFEGEVGLYWGDNSIAKI
jgi:uracil-DNA glycosylase family 4